MSEDLHGLLTTREAAKQLGITTTGLSDAVVRGRISVARAGRSGMYGGGHWTALFDPDEIDRFRKARAARPQGWNFKHE